MPYCSNCGVKVPENISFCENCGAPIEQAEDSSQVQISKITPAGFCTECGTPYAKGALFCENCGAKTDGEAEKKEKSGSKSVDAKPQLELFSQKNWKELWEKAARDCMDCGKELGIVLAEEKDILEVFSITKDQFMDCLGKYLVHAAARGVVYYYLNADSFINGSGSYEPSDLIPVLTEIVNAARPKYLMLLGDGEHIAPACWENKSCDSDEQVESDMAYSLLDGTSPWEGQKFNLTQALRVGRVPYYDGQSFESFWSYFENTMKGTGTLDELKTFGLSAFQWEDTSNNIYEDIKNKGSLYMSPKMEADKMSGFISEDTNILYFNLHGSDNAKFWYGQEGLDFPEAYSPELFKERSKPYFVGVEACYGARFIELKSKDSCVLSALENRCLAFLGSSKIAYGTPSGPGTCADIVIREFLSRIESGETAGDAHIASLKKLVEESDMDDTDIKTFAEFALYGDPSVSTGKNPNAGKMKNLMKGIMGIPKGIKVPLPDVRKAVHSEIVKLDAKLESQINDYVAKNFMSELNAKGFDMDEIFMQTSRLTNSGMNQKVFTKETDLGSNIVKVYFDDSGKIHKTLVSK